MCFLGHFSCDIIKSILSSLARQQRSAEEGRAEEVQLHATVTCVHSCIHTYPRAIRLLTTSPRQYSHSRSLLTPQPKDLCEGGAAGATPDAGQAVGPVRPGRPAHHQAPDMVAARRHEGQPRHCHQDPHGCGKTSRDEKKIYINIFNEFQRYQSLHNPTVSIPLYPFPTHALMGLPL